MLAVAAAAGKRVIDATGCGHTPGLLDALQTAKLRVDIQLRVITLQL